MKIFLKSLVDRTTFVSSDKVLFVVGATGKFSLTAVNKTYTLKANDVVNIENGSFCEIINLIDGENEIELSFSNSQHQRFISAGSSVVVSNKELSVIVDNDNLIVSLSAKTITDLAQAIVDAKPTPTQD